MYEITVIIPSYNRCKILGKTLGLLTEQTCPHDKFEVIVVDDGSVDDTEKMVRGLQGEMDYSLRHIKKAHRGPASARNSGVREARSNFVLFIGDDIFPQAELVERHIKSLRTNPEAAILGFVDWSGGHEVTGFMNYIAPNGFQFRYNTIADPNNCDFRHFYTSNISLAKKWLLKDCFDEDFPYGSLEDVELAYRLKKRGLRIIFNDKAIGYHFHPMTIESFCRRMGLTGISAITLIKKHPELKPMLLPVNMSLAGVIFSVLARISFVERINKKFYWFCRIANSYLDGIKVGAPRDTDNALDAGNA